MYPDLDTTRKSRHPFKVAAWLCGYVLAVMLGVAVILSLLIQAANP